MTAQEEITPENIPYVLNESGDVVGVLRRYRIRGGHTMDIFIPYPKGPDDGWTPGQREKYMNDLYNSAATGVRTVAKQQYGTTSFRLVSHEETTESFEVCAEQYRGMLAREAQR